MKPFIKLIHDEERKTWICGDEDGELLLATDEFIEDTPPMRQSKVLRAVVVKDGPPPADFTPGKNCTATLHKMIIGRYMVRVGFSSETNTWAYYDRFTYAQDERSLAEKAYSLKF